MNLIRFFGVLSSIVCVSGFLSPNSKRSMCQTKLNGLPPPLITSTGVIHDVLNVAIPLIVPAHGSVDVFDALQNNKTKNYLSANLLAYIGYPLVNYGSPDMAMFLFLTLSSYHFRHQFEIFGKELSIVPSILFVYYGYSHPEILYLFLAFVHTPHQYWKFRDVVLKNKELSTVVITVLTGTGMCISYNDWSNNVFITATLVAHILYQECIRFY